MIIGESPGLESATAPRMISGPLLGNDLGEVRFPKVASFPNVGGHLHRGHIPGEAHALEKAHEGVGEVEFPPAVVL